jgi:hypothetical protein
LKNPAGPVELLIASGGSQIRTAAPINHRIYADRIGVPYVCDIAPSSVRRVFLHKIDLLRRLLPCAEWVFWIDDDAFFTDHSIDLRTFLEGTEGRDLVFCRSPVNPRGGWTWMSGGQFFIRRSQLMMELLDAVLATDLEAVRAWWRADEYGIFTNGDQDAIVYHLMGPDQRWRDRFLRLPSEVFNSRPYHYDRRLDEHFICHFAVPGGRPKAELIAEFVERMGTTPALCHADLFEPYRVFLERSQIGPLIGVTVPAQLPAWRRGPGPLARAVVRRVARAMRGQSAGSA